MGWLFIAIIVSVAFAFFRNLDANKPFISTSYKPNDDKDLFEDWRNSLSQLWGGNVEAEINYDTPGKGIQRRKVIISHVLESPYGHLYYRGYCQLKSDIRFFRLDRIKGDVFHKNNMMSADVFLHELVNNKL